MRGGIKFDELDHGAVKVLIHTVQFLQEQLAGEYEA